MRRSQHRTDANQAALLVVAEQLGWCALNASQSNMGFDALLIKAGRIVIAEIKDGSKPLSAQKLTDHEKDVHARLKAHGITIEILTCEADVLALERPPRSGGYYWSGQAIGCRCGTREHPVMDPACPRHGASHG